MIVNVHTDHQDFKNEVAYVMLFLQNHPLKPKHVDITMDNVEADTHIFYTSEKSENFWIPRQNVLFSEHILSSSNLHANVYVQAGTFIYSVEKDQKTKATFIENQCFGFDIIESIFFYISRYEEYHCTDNLKDQWGMMHEQHHFAVRKGLYHTPIVDVMVVAFFNALGIEVEDRPTLYAMTHDIDVLAKFKNTSRKLRSTLRSSLDHGLQGLTKASKYIAKVNSGEIKDPYDTFDYLFTPQAFDRKFCFVMAGGETKHDNYYDIQSEEARAMIQLAKARGYEIGLHPSYNAGYKANLFTSEKAALENQVSNNIQYSRQHFLRYDFPRTSDIIENNEIQMESTLGYQRLIGYRCGTGFPYSLYHFEKRKPYTHKELPMVIMDGGLLDEADQDLNKAKKMLHDFLFKNQYNTYVTFNFHNTIFDPLKRDVDVMKEIYAVCLDVSNQ